MKHIFSGGLLGQLASVGGEFISDQVLLIKQQIFFSGCNVKLLLKLSKKRNCVFDQILFPLQQRLNQPVHEELGKIGGTISR